MAEFERLMERHNELDEEEGRKVRRIQELNEELKNQQERNDEI